LLELGIVFYQLHHQSLLKFFWQYLLEHLPNWGQKWTQIGMENL
jgi:hypothetical protein